GMKSLVHDSPTLRCAYLHAWSEALLKAGRYSSAHTVAAKLVSHAHRGKVIKALLDGKSIMAECLSAQTRYNEAITLLRTALRRYSRRSTYESRLRARVLILALQLR